MSHIWKRWQFAFCFTFMYKSPLKVIGKRTLINQLISYQQNKEKFNSTLNAFIGLHTLTLFHVEISCGI